MYVFTVTVVIILCLCMSIIICVYVSWYIMLFSMQYNYLISFSLECPITEPLLYLLGPRDEAH